MIATPDPEKLAAAQVMAQELLKRLEGGDTVAKVCAEEILQFGCDILASLDAEYSPESILAVLLTVAQLGQHKVEGWNQYTREHAPEVVAQIRAGHGVPGRRPPIKA